MKKFAAVLKFNPNHDKLGLFTSPEGGGSGTSDHAQLQSYLRGQCWPFAVALQRQYGGELQVVVDPQHPDDPPVHAVVKRGKYLTDASGTVTMSDLKKRYQLSPKARLQPATEKDIDAIDPLKPDEIAAATKFILSHA